MAHSNRVQLIKDKEELIAALQEYIKKLEDRCDRLQEEVNALENPPHQLCGHSARNCSC